LISIKVNDLVNVLLLLETTEVKMEHKAVSIRPFIGAANFEVSRAFYRDLGFQEVELTPAMSLFKTGNQGFYLQNAFNRDWIDNTMVFLEVEDVQRFWDALLKLDLSAKYKNVRLTPIRVEHWGRECFVHDPSGILWHFGEFFTN
jgi:catechol 2,3-dioxygenase-like lactoylglutathione lyase family enzyme